MSSQPKDPFLAFSANLFRATGDVIAQDTGDPELAIIHAAQRPQVGMFVSTRASNGQLDEFISEIKRREAAFSTALEKAEKELGCTINENEDRTIIIHNPLFDETMEIPAVSTHSTPTPVRDLNDFVEVLSDLQKDFEGEQQLYRQMLFFLEQEQECEVTDLGNGKHRVTQHTYRNALELDSSTPQLLETSLHVMKTFAAQNHASDKHLAEFLAGLTSGHTFTPTVQEDGSILHASEYKHFITGQRAYLTYRTSPEGRIDPTELNRFAENVRNFNFGNFDDRPPFKQLLREHYGLHMQEDQMRIEDEKMSELHIQHVFFDEVETHAPTFYRLPRVSNLWAQFLQSANPDEQNALIDQMNDTQNQYAMFGYNINEVIRQAALKNAEYNQRLGNVRRFAKQAGLTEASDVQKMTPGKTEFFKLADPVHGDLSIPVLRLIDVHTKQSYIVPKREALEDAEKTLNERYGYVPPEVSVRIRETGPASKPEV